MYGNGAALLHNLRLSTTTFLSQKVLFNASRTVGCEDVWALASSVFDKVGLCKQIQQPIQWTWHWRLGYLLPQTPPSLIARIILSGIQCKITNIFCHSTKSCSITLVSVTQNMPFPQNFWTTVSHTKYAISTQFLNLRQQHNETNHVTFVPESLKISSWFSYDELFLLKVSFSQQVHGAHVEIVVIM